MGAMSSAKAKKSRGRASVTLNSDIKELLDQVVEQTGHDRNELLRRLLTWFLSEQRPIQLWALLLQEPDDEISQRVVRELLDRTAGDIEAVRRRLDQLSGASA